MSTDRPPTPPLDLDAIEARRCVAGYESRPGNLTIRGPDPDVIALVAEVKGLRADLEVNINLYRAELRRLHADLAACRAALAPLLWEPRRTMYASGAPPALVCVFCAVDAPGHAPDCPVLRRAALLGAGGEEGA